MTDDITPVKAPAVLTREDLGSHCWQALAKHMEARLVKLRVKNESDLDPIATATLRGECRSLKNLLALANPGPASAASEELPE